MQSRILNLLNSRFELGKERYTHGVKINNDTRKWGTKNNDWFEMMQEELLDGLVYCAASALKNSNYIRPETHEDDNVAIFNWICKTIDYTGDTTEHQKILKNLYNSILLSLSFQDSNEIKTQVEN